MHHGPSYIGSAKGHVRAWVERTQVEAARVLLAERAKLPPPGVYTTALAFGNTDLLDRLGKAGVTTSIVSDTTSTPPTPKSC
jgi:short subunit dehydrogenase-like uncharacterized protein